MTSHVFSVNIDDSLKEVRSLLNKHKIRHVPVVKDKSLVGIISRTDINRLTFSGMYDDQEDADDAVFEMLSISQVMTHKPKVVKQSDAIKKVAEVFASSEFHALPVVADDNKTELVGIITTTDVIKYMLTLL
ncbi:MAG: CBS domain-containing protein [Cyclobacteriaceae bacterium]|nr:CBS domain-containing protein [Cyclobacteriaceae bacterium]